MTWIYLVLAAVFARCNAFATAEQDSSNQTAGELQARSGPWFTLYEDSMCTHRSFGVSYSVENPGCFQNHGPYAQYVNLSVEQRRLSVILADLSARIPDTLIESTSTSTSNNGVALEAQAAMRRSSTVSTSIPSSYRTRLTSMIGRAWCWQMLDFSPGLARIGLAEVAVVRSTTL